MWQADVLQRELTGRGDLWETGPGLTGLRGATLWLYGELERRITEVARGEALEEWRVPPAIGLETLARAEYFASFPHWLTCASHLPEDGEVLARVAASFAPAETAGREQAAATAALSPAVCYHVYEALADSVVEHPRIITAQQTCWRYEAPHFRALERGWGFTMREVVCVGSPDAVAEFLGKAVGAAVELAATLGLAPSIEAASDPFFAPSSRGKELLQRLKGLKRELLLPIEAGRFSAAASFNHHETFFGDAFGIRLPDGSAARTACLAFGIERWLLAFLSTHGPEPQGWPASFRGVAQEDEKLHLPLQEAPR